MKPHQLLLKFFFLIIMLGFFCFLLFSSQKDVALNYQFNFHYNNNNNFTKDSFQEINEIVVNYLNNRDTLSKDINIRLLEELVFSNQYVNKAEVYLDLEGVINIEVSFRQPFFSVLRDSKIYYFDSEGGMLPKLTRFPKNLVVLSGDLSNDKLKESLLLVHQIYNNQTLNSLIGGIHYNKKDGYVLSAKAFDLAINIGNELVINKNKLDKIKLFYNFLSSNLPCNYCQAIDIKYDKQIICVN